MRFIGDVHGKWMTYKNRIACDHPTVQIGDMGVGFGNEERQRVTTKLFLDEYAGTDKDRFIRGNHDNPATCKGLAPKWIADGTVEDNIMYLGGAWSIDHARRMQGVDWWEDEEVSYEHLQYMIDVYAHARPELMVTHDCPHEIAYEMFIRKRNSGGGPFHQKTRTVMALQAMFEIHQPKLWIFGHRHHTRQYEQNGTLFQCVDELDYVDVDTDDAEIKRTYTREGDQFLRMSSTI